MEADQPATIQPMWKFSQVYLRQDLNKIAICRLYDAAGHHHNAEVSYGGGSPTNLLHQFDASYPGHREALEKTKKDKSGGDAAGTAVATGGGSHMKMTAYGMHSKGPA